MVVDIVGVMRDLDTVFFEATVSTLATVMALVPGGDSPGSGCCVGCD